MSIPLSVVNFSGWQNNSRARAVKEFIYGGPRGDFTTFDTPFIEWSIQEINQESVVGIGEGIAACKYLLTQETSVTQQQIIDAPDLSPGGPSGLIRPIAYQGFSTELDEYGDPYSYDYYADGTFRAGCNFELKITDPIEEGIWFLYVIALSKDGQWGPVQ